MDVNGAYCQNDGPRELEIFSDEQVEEVMESLEYFRCKIEQLQVYCEQVSQSKLRSDEAVLEEKRKHQQEILKYQEEVNVLRSINVQLMSGKVASAGKRGNASLSCAIDSENAESRIQELESNLRSLELTFAEKEKHVSVMEWQIMDMEATIATLQAERDQLVLELELHDSHSSLVESSENLGGMTFQEEDYCEEERHVERDNINRRKTKTLASVRPHSHSDLWRASRGSENLSLKQIMSLSVEWLPKDSPMRARKLPQRTFSDYVKRDSHGCPANLANRNTTHSLEDFDNLSEVDSGLGLGKLTRTTNFCDILDADEYSNFHIADNRLSFTGDSIQGEQASNDGESESLTKKWETFDGDLPMEETPDKLLSGNVMPISENPPPNEPFGAIDGCSLGSSTSDFSSAFNSSQDVLLSGTEEPWPSSNNELACGELFFPEGHHKKLSKRNISKSDSCITKRSPPSDKEDMWNFTPDSILNVSTGEVLPVSPTIGETPSTPTIKKSRSFTSSLEIILKDPKSKKDNDKEDPEGTTMDEMENTEEDTRGNVGIDSEKLEDTKTVFREQPVRLRNLSGGSLRAKHARKSRSFIESTDQTESCASEGGTAVHQKSHSDPVKEGEKGGPRKLTEYQKWRKYGRKGKPPGDLRISDC